MKNNRGFTLLELLMVVIIIAILASIAVPQYFRASERAGATEPLQVLGAIRQSQLRYRALSATNAFATGGGACAGQTALLDIDIPGSACNANSPPASARWTGYDVNNAANGRATRAAGGFFGGSTIDIDLAAGLECSSNAVYGLPVGAC